MTNIWLPTASLLRVEVSPSITMVAAAALMVYVLVVTDGLLDADAGVVLVTVKVEPLMAVILPMTTPLFSMFQPLCKP